MKSSSPILHAAPKDGKKAYLLPSSNTEDPSLLATSVSRYFPL